MYHTPTIFLNVLRGCGIYQNHQGDIKQVLPTGENRWNDWVHATRNGNPYLVLEHKGTRFSVSRVRRSKYETWKFLVRWPFPGSDQQRETVEYGHMVAEVIRKNS